MEKGGDGEVGEMERWGRWRRGGDGEGGEMERWGNIGGFILNARVKSG